MLDDILFALDVYPCAQYDWLLDCPPELMRSHAWQALITRVEQPAYPDGHLVEVYEPPVEQSTLTD